MQAVGLKTWFIDQIHSGKFAVNSALPTRYEVMQRFGVARATVDRVVKQLTEVGVYSQRESGTFVTPRPENTPPHAYVIVPNKPSSNGGDFWQDLDTEVGGRVNFSLLSFNDILNVYDRLMRSGARVAWHYPSLEHFATIASLTRSGVPQILLNRRHPAI